MKSDTDLLQSFVEDGCEASFSALVDRYAGLVFAVARRRVRSPELSEEIAQNVFLVLARKASKIRRKEPLAPWLHRVAVLEAAAVSRAEGRRLRRHERLAIMNEIERSSETESQSERLPQLDEAVQQLRPADRDLLFRRFFEGQSFEELAQRLEISETAGRKRLSRALKRLSGLLQRRGVAVSATVLATSLASHWSQAAPAGLAAQLTRTAIAGAATTTSTNITLLSASIMTSKLTTIAAVTLGAALPLSWHWAHSRSGSAVSISAGAIDLDAGVPELLASSESSQLRSAEPVGFSLAALARELRRLPLPGGSLERVLELLMYTLSEEQIRQVIPLFEEAPNANAIVTIVSAAFSPLALG